MSTSFSDYDLTKTDGVIFDLDGTLWDSAQQIADAWNELLRTRPDIVREDITKEELYSNMGLPMYDIAANLFPNEEPAVRNALMDDMGLFENEYLLKTGGTLFEGIRETVESIAKRYPVFIVSNAQSGYIEAFLTVHGFKDIFTDHCCWGDTGKSKGENIAKLSKKNGLKFPVYIGDTDSDSKACRIAGVPFIFAAYGFGDTGNYTERIEAPEELLGILL